MKEQIEVLQEDIDGAILNMWWEANPLSIAMLREWGSFHVVDLDKSKMLNTEIGIYYRLSEEAVAFIRKYVAGEKVKPCTLEVENIEQNFYKMFVGEQKNEPQQAASTPWSPGNSSGPKDSPQ